MPLSIQLSMPLSMPLSIQLSMVNLGVHYVRAG